MNGQTERHGMVERVVEEDGSCLRTRRRASSRPSHREPVAGTLTVDGVLAHLTPVLP